MNKCIIMITFSISILIFAGCHKAEGEISLAEHSTNISWNGEESAAVYNGWKMTLHKAGNNELFVTDVECVNGKEEKLALEIPEKIGEYLITGVGKKREWYPKDIEFSQSIFGEWIESAHSDTCETDVSKRIIRINLPEGIRTIEADAFAGCGEVREIEFPDSVENIHGEAFFGCRNLRKVTMGAKLAKLEVSAFNGCGMLDEIVIDKNNGNYAIEAGMVVLRSEKRLLMVPRGKEEITIPESVTDIEKGALNYGRLKKINVSSKHKFFAKDGNCIYYKKNGELAIVEVKKSALKDKMIISNKVKMISGKAVHIGKTGKKHSVIIGKNVKTVSGYWMDFDNHADTYVFEGKVPPKVKNRPDGYSGVPVFCKVYVHKNVKDRYKRWLAKYGVENDVELKTI